MGLGEAGVGEAHGLLQADQGAHGIQQKALRGRQDRPHYQSASQPAATRSWWERPGSRLR